MFQRILSPPTAPSESTRTRRSGCIFRHSAYLTADASLVSTCPRTNALPMNSTNWTKCCDRRLQCRDRCHDSCGGSRRHWTLQQMLPYYLAVALGRPPDHHNDPGVNHGVYLLIQLGLAPAAPSPPSFVTVGWNRGIKRDG